MTLKQNQRFLKHQLIRRRMWTNVFARAVQRVPQRFTISQLYAGWVVQKNCQYIYLQAWLLSSPTLFSRWDRLWQLYAFRFCFNTLCESGSPILRKDNRVNSLFVRGSRLLLSTFDSQRSAIESLLILWSTKYSQGTATLSMKRQHSQVNYSVNKRNNWQQQIHNASSPNLNLQIEPPPPQEPPGWMS